jgi:hypothetical protein
VKRIGAIVLGLALAVAGAACSKGSDNAKAPATTVPSAPAGATAATSTPASTGPVTDADVTEVDQILHRLDSELDRLDSDMATGEGDVQ